MSITHDTGSKRVTLQDVAARAGVAVSTVSRILIGEKTLSIRPETRQRVLEAARALAYRPNQQARTLRTRRSYSFGVVVPEIDNPAFTTIIQGAQRAALENRHSLLIGYVDKHYPDLELYRRLVHDNQVGGLLVTTIQNPDLTQGLHALGVPYVLVNRRLDDNTPRVLVDYEAGTRQAVAHLCALGHRRIGYVSGPLAHYTGRSRLAGYRAGLAEAGIVFEASLVQECEYDRAGAEAAALRLLQGTGERPTALCAANVAVASGILVVARGLGIAVPEQLSVIALLDGPAANMLTPSITAVQYPFFELGHTAALDLMDLMAQRPLRDRLRVLPPGGIAARESTGPAPAVR